MAKGKPTGRYPRSVINDRIQREVHRRIPPGMTEPFDVKGITDRIGMTPDDWYKRTGKRRTPFTFEEAGRIADEVDAPPCWPAEEWSTLEALFPNWKWKGGGIKK